jgi:hypothetical protein
MMNEVGREPIRAKGGAEFLVASCFTEFGNREVFVKR